LSTGTQRKLQPVMGVRGLRTPFFDKKAWQNLEPELGGPNRKFESAEKITDVWCLPTSTGKNGHGAEFPLALAGRCIALTSREGDLVLDPFVGGGTTAVAAVVMGRRCLGYDISEKYIDIAAQRLAAAAERGRQLAFEEGAADVESPSTDAAEVRASIGRRTSPTRPAGSDSSRTEVSETPQSQSALSAVMSIGRSEGLEPQPFDP
jgi:DNA methylase